jgi:hypothetical protein
LLAILLALFTTDDQLPGEKKFPFRVPEIVILLAG